MRWDKRESAVIKYVPPHADRPGPTANPDTQVSQSVKPEV